MIDMLIFLCFCIGLSILTVIAACLLVIKLAALAFIIYIKIWPALCRFGRWCRPPNL